MLDKNAGRHLVVQPILFYKDPIGFPFSVVSDVVLDDQFKKTDLLWTVKEETAATLHTVTHIFVFEASYNFH